MRKYLFLFYTIFLLSFSSSIKAQYVSIPDANFRDYLEINFPTCMQGGMMDTTCTGIIKATQIIVNGLNIADLNGIQYFDKLEHLKCNQNQLTYLPVLPATLTTLECSGNMLTSLPELPSGIYSIFCLRNALTSLPLLPNNLLYLQCGSNQLTVLPSLPNTLQQLNCNNNQVTDLSALPAALEQLMCNGNQLTSLPVLPPSITIIDCGYNFITSLPLLPSSLIFLYCHRNQLTSMPVLPQGLEELNCGMNQLNQLPSLPATLKYLLCGGNTITVLPYLPSGLVNLTCTDNLLTELPYLPANLSYLNCMDNNIVCLPVLPNSIYWLATDSICRPNRPTALHYEVPRNYPLCTDLKFTFNRVCAGDSTLFHLENANCHAFIWDFDDPVSGAQNNSTDMNPKHLFTHPGTFQVKLTSYVSNPATIITQSVIVDELSVFDLGSDHNFCKEDEIVLKVGSNYSSCVWQDGSTALTYAVEKTGMYSVTATNACGSFSDHIQLTEYDLNIPNLFTPNNDGINDTFVIEGMNGDAGSLKVFNSWGAEVYSSNRYYNSWNGKDLSDGIYYYSFQLNSCPVKKGLVQITR